MSGRAGGSSRGEPARILSEVWGFTAFRGLQEEAVAQLMRGGDALVLMPTGGGKSLCYQLPMLSRPGLGLVVSPLIALMDDQVAALRQVGVDAAALHSELDEDAAALLWDKLADGRLEILYVSPERLLAGSLLERLSRRPVSLLAIDEAHCVSAWGHEFRPEYRELRCLPERLPGVPRVALTATADPRTRADIVDTLGLENAAVLVASFHRDNLLVHARPKLRELDQLASLLDRHPDHAGIVYCGSRDKTERVATALRANGHNAQPYHARLSPIEKRAALGRFRQGEAMTMVATIAFGMGIDRPDVRFVAHLDMPESPEAYYQQIGRAGRDGEPADTLLLYGAEDISRARYWLDQSAAPAPQKRVMADRLEGMIGFCETAECRTVALLACFGEQFSGPCGHCDNCRSPAVLHDGTVAAQKALSAIYRTGQRFGAVHIANVLLGRETEATRRHNHASLPTWGIGREEGAEFWRSVIRTLLARGALARDGEHGGLQFTPSARNILRGETAVMLKREEERPASAPAAASSTSASARRGEAAAALPPADAGLFERLRAWRADEARAQGLPPYVIFHDSVLREIAGGRPDSRTALGAIKGVGASKLERYADAIMAIVRAA